MFRRNIVILLISLLTFSVILNGALFSKNYLAKHATSKSSSSNVNSSETVKEPLSKPLPDNSKDAIWWSGSTDKKQVALTFDDGPNPTYTPQILATLDKYGARATFFEVGSYADKFPNITKEIVQKGHSLGNHTFSHPTNRVTTAEKESQLTKTSNLLEKITGKKINLFRSPYGYFDTTFFTLSRKLGMYQIMWSVVPDDYEKPGVRVIADRVLQQTQNGSIVLLHDGGGDRTQTVQALPIIIEELQKKGYTFVTVNELLDLK